MDLTPIINALLALIAAIVTAFLLPWLKRKMSAADLEKLRGWIDVGVAAAEQMFTTADAGAKKEYVLNFLAEQGYTVSTTQVLSMIEASVLTLHNQLYGTEKVTAAKTE